MKHYSIVLLILCGLAPKALVSQSLDSLPVVFTVGEYGKQYEELVSDCELPLLQAAGKSMDQSSEHWLRVMQEIEKFCEMHDFDIKGVKLWVNIFWNADGRIRHIVYFPKRSSRNIDFARLGNLLGAFAMQSEARLRAPDCYSHFGSASFPTHADYLLNHK